MPVFKIERRLNIGIIPLLAPDMVQSNYEVKTPLLFFFVIHFMYATFELSTESYLSKYTQKHPT